MSATPNILHVALKQILEQHATLSRNEARELLDFILGHLENSEDKTAAGHRVAALLGALAARGETIDELAGFVDALRARSTPIPLDTSERLRLVDTCGTGGDLSGTFNISTAAALVAAAAGALVAKHGNRAVTSRCGSADVLEALGIPVELAPRQAADALRTHGFAFLPAPALQPAMRAVMPLRRALGVRTAFNILGPMSNPAGARAQVIGVYAANLVPIVAQTLARLDTRHAFVVHGQTSDSSNPGAPGMDEISLSGPTALAEVRGTEVSYSTVTPEVFGLSPAPVEALAGGDAAANAAILREIFAGHPGPRRDVVLLNTAAVLVTAGLATNFLFAVRLAQDTIDSGQVTRLIAGLAS